MPYDEFIVTKITRKKIKHNLYFLLKYERGGRGGFSGKKNIIK